MRLVAGGTKAAETQGSNVGVAVCFSPQPTARIDKNWAPLALLRLLLLHLKPFLVLKLVGDEDH